MSNRPSWKERAAARRRLGEEQLEDQAVKRGDRVRVIATGQVGTVQYVRFAPPDFTELAAVSVYLDDRAAACDDYAGTIFTPAKLEAE